MANSERNMYYKHNMSLYGNNASIVEELKYLWDNYPDYDFYRFNPGYYKEKYLKKYGFEIVNKLASNYKDGILEFGLENENNYKKVKFYCESKLFNLDVAIVLSDYITLDDMKYMDKLLNNMDYEVVFKKANDESSVHLLKEIIYDEKSLKNMNFIGAHFDVYYVHDNFFEIVKSDDFHEFISKIDDSYLKSDDNINNLFDMFDLYKNNNLKNLNKEIFNDYIFNYNNLKYEINNDDNYYEQKLYHTKENINKLNNLNDNLDLVSNVYFNRKYKQVINLLNDTKKLLEKNNLIDDYFMNLYEFTNIKNEDELNHYLSTLKYETNIGYKLVSLSKNLARISMANKINNGLYIIKNKEIIKLNGEDFYMLVHKIKGFSNQGLATKLYNDPSNWTKHQDENSYISTSAINHDYMGIVEGYGYVLGFYNISKDDILQMGPSDIFTDRKIVKNNLNNTKARYMDPDDLIDNTKEMYNEVVLRRYKNDLALLPDYVLSKDNITKKDEEVSRYFDIPIVEIDSNIYAKKMMEKYNYYINNFEFKKASICLMRLVKGFSQCDILENNYLDIAFLEKDINIILNNYFNSCNVSKEGLTELLELVSIYDKAINLLSYQSNRYCKFDANDLKNKINAKIH